MKTKEIVKASKNSKKGMTLSETDLKILESLKNMSQQERIKTIYEMLDSTPNIDLHSPLADEIHKNYECELLALRKANGCIKRYIPATHADSLSKKAVELLNS